MKKPFNVLSKASMIAAITASSIIPVAVSAAEVEQQAVDLEMVLLEKDGKYFEISVEEYLSEKSFGTGFEPVKLVQSSEGKYYKLDDYLSYKAFINGEITETFADLDEDNKEVVLERVGKVVIDEKTGEVSYVLDEQPEDRLNETFFYNVA